MRLTNTTFLLLCTLLLPCTVWATMGMMQVGYGVKSHGMGGIGVARSMDAFVVAQNPAGLTRLCNRFDVGLQWPRIDGQYRVTDPDPNNSKKQRMVSHMVWPEAGGVVSLRRRFTAGVAIYAFGGWDVHYKEEDENLGSSPLGSKLEAYYLTPAIAWQVTACHAIGIALNVAEAHFRAKGLQKVAPDGTNRGFSRTYGASLRIGWLAQPLSCISVGLTYQTPTWMGKFDRYGILLPNGGEFRLPSQIGAGLTWRFHPLLCGSADVVKIFWRDSPLFRSIAPDTPRGFGWRNQVAFKFGLSWEIVERLVLRIGYAHADSPILPSAALYNTVTQAVNKDTVTGGLTYCCGCNEFSFAYMRGLAHHITGDTFLDSTVEPSIRTVRLRARQDVFGFSYGRRF